MPLLPSHVAVVVVLLLLLLTPALLVHIDPLPRAEPPAPHPQARAAGADALLLVQADEEMPSHTSQTLAPPPPPPLTPPRSRRRRRERNVLASVVYTLCFHIAALLFGVALLLLLVLTVGGAGLLLLCICSGSSRSVRVLVASLWRAELWINRLGVDDVKRENDADAAATARSSDARAHFEQLAFGASTNTSSATNSAASTSTATASATASTTGRSHRAPTQQRGREVTTSVMVLSLLYFLLFKWLFNIVFSAIPLAFWSIVIAQFVVTDSEMLGDVVDTVSGNGTKYFVGIAIGFLAHQISLTAAVGCVFVSEKMAGFLFEEASRAEDPEYAPLLHWTAAGQSELPTPAYQYHTAMTAHSVFEPPRAHDEHHQNRPPVLATQSTPGSYQSSFNSRRDDRPRLDASASPFDQRTARARGSVPENRGAAAVPTAAAAAARGNGVPSALPVSGAMPYPPMPPMPPFRPGMGDYEAAYRDQAEERVVDCCMFKIHIRRSNVDDSDPHGREGGRGRGRGDRRGNGREGGRGRGRGDFSGGVPPMRGSEYRPGFGPTGFGPAGFDPAGFDPEFRHPFDGFPTDPRLSAHNHLHDHRLRRDPRTDWFAKMKWGRHGLNRTKSFDSLQAATEQENLPPHMQMCEVLDLSPSAPPPHPAFSTRRDRFSRSRTDVPVARLADDLAVDEAFDPRYRPSVSKLPMRKSNSDEGRYPAQKEPVGQDYLEQTERIKEQAQRMREQTQRIREQAQREKEQTERRVQQKFHQQQRQEQQQQRQEQQQQRQEQQQQQQQRRVQESQIQSPAVLPVYPETQHPQSPTSYLREREVYAKDRDFYHDGITQAALDGIEKAKLEEKELAASGDPPTSSGSSGPRVIRRPVSSGGSSSARDISAPVTDTQIHPLNDEHISFTGPYQAAPGDAIDWEIHGQFGSLPPTFEDTSYLDAFRPPGGQSSSETITTLNDAPKFRGPPEYNQFSPPVSPTSTTNGSFLVNTASYDLYSPTNSVQHDDDFPSDQLPQVYRSIRYTGPPAMANSRFSEFDDVPGRRDKVHFNAFAPPSVAPSPKPFNYTVWAFLLNQREEMRERAEAFDPSGRKLSVDTKLDIRRGALVHVTLEAPEGFRILNGATQGFPWEGKVCNATFDVQCTDGAAFGSVMFKASIVVGSEVAILRSYVSVSPKKLEPADLEAQMLNSQLEVLEKSYQEIPYKSLEMKELVGVGHFGDAYRATFNGQDVVVKTIRASEFGETSDQIVQEFQHEAAVLNMFGHHPCVVPFVGASTDIRFPLSIVTAYLPYGSLEDNLRGESSAAEGGAFTIRQKTAMLKDAAAGLLNMHEGGFIHRDIAARNCLVDDNLRVKICDFGLCRRVSATGGTLMKDGVGPVKYMAPESLLPPHLFSYESDSYMFGVLMWETFTMSSPFASLSPLEAVLKVMNGERLAVPPDLPETLRSLMETCFHDSPAQRPSMVEIMATLDELSASTRARKASSGTPGRNAAVVAAAASASLSSATQLRADRSSIWV